MFNFYKMLVLSLVLLNQIFATTYYLNLSGTGSGTGSWNNAKALNSFNFQTLVAGDIVYIDGGVTNGAGITYTKDGVGYDAGAYEYNGERSPSMNKKNNNYQYDFSLFQNYPNPFNPSTSIGYSLPVNGLTILKVYDMLGNEIATLVNEDKEAGSYRVELNASNLSSGIYFYSLTSGSYSMNKKMILMK